MTISVITKIESFIIFVKATYLIANKIGSASLHRVGNMRKCLSFNHCNINIPVSNSAFSCTFSCHQVPEISLNGSLVMNIRCEIEILLA